MQQDIRVDADAAVVVSSRDTGVSIDPDVPDDARMTAELLVEEVSIDGMCGVY